MCLKRHKDLQMKTTMSGMGNKMMGNSRLDIAEENIRDLEYLVRKMTKNETKTETRSSHQESKKKTVSANCSKSLS
jgi:signal recognition particle GTPase